MQTLAYAVPVVVLLLSVSCATAEPAGAAAARDGGVVYLAADAYGCGAAEGLGCGLAIAPVLAEIDALEGVRESGVSWDGRYFRIELRPGADGSRVLASSAELLEGGVTAVPAARVRHVDAWYDAEGTAALSRYEAEVIAAGTAADLEAEVELDAEERRRVAEVLREEVEAVFERAHAAGGGVHRLHEGFPEAQERLAERLGFLGSERRDSVLAYLERRFGE